MLVQRTNLKKTGNVFTSKFVGTGPSSYKNRIYQAAVSQRLRNTGLEHWFPSCAPRILTSSRGSVDTFLIRLFWSFIYFFK